MFIKTCKKKIWSKEYETHYIAESYRDEKTKKIKHKHILSLSKLEPRQIEALRNSFKQEQEEKSKKNWNIEKEIKFYNTNKIQILDTKEYWSIKVFEHLFNKYFFWVLDKKYYEQIKAITINKIFEPKSKNSLDNWLKKVDLDFRIDTKSSKDKLYKSLDYLEKEQENIEKKLYKKNKIENSTCDLYLYDITSTYFEWKWDENICKYWYSRDHRQDRVQVNIWLVTNNKWIPLAVEILEWNISDKQTVQNKIDVLKERFWIENITFVFDRWMKTKANLDYIIESWYDYITALTHSELRNKAKENKDIEMSLFDKHNLAEFIEDMKDEKWNLIKDEKWNIKKIKYVLSHNPMKKLKDTKDRIKLIEKTEKLLSSIQELKTYKQWKLTQLEIQEKITKKINKFNCSKYIFYEIKENSFSFERKDSKIKEDENYDWFYMIESLEIYESKENIEKKYKSLQLVERAFDDVKNMIEIRPVFHYKESRIKWHIFSCFMSYYLLHRFKEIVEDLLETNTLDYIITEIQKITKTYIKIESLVLEKINELNLLQLNILKRFNVKNKID